MPRAFLFSEEGRAGRGLNLLLALFLVLWFAVSWVAGYWYFRSVTKGNFTALQSVYWNQYWQSSWRASFIPFEPKSTHFILLRDVKGRPLARGSGQNGRNSGAGRTERAEAKICLDEEVTAVYDEAGYIHRREDGMPDVRLESTFAPGTERFYWDKWTVKDSIARAKFRDLIYQGRTVTQIYRPAALCGGLVFASGLGAAFALRRRRIRLLLRGKALRGTRLLTPRQYAREMRHETGVGIEAYPQEGR